MILFGMIGCQHRTVIQTLYSLILYPAQAKDNDLRTFSAPENLKMQVNTKISHMQLSFVTPLCVYS